MLGSLVPLPFMVTFCTTEYRLNNMKVCAFYTEAGQEVIGREIELKYLLDCGIVIVSFLFFNMMAIRSDLTIQVWLKAPYCMFFSSYSFCMYFICKYENRTSFTAFSTWCSLMDSSSITRSKTIWDTFFRESHAYRFSSERTFSDFM